MLVVQRRVAGEENERPWPKRGNNLLEVLRWVAVVLRIEPVTSFRRAGSSFSYPGFALDMQCRNSADVDRNVNCLKYGDLM